MYFIFVILVFLFSIIQLLAARYRDVTRDKQGKEYIIRESIIFPLLYPLLLY